MPACPYHNPTTTMGHNVDIRKQVAQTMPYTLSAICPVQLKPGLIHEEHTSVIFMKFTVEDGTPLTPLKSLHCYNNTI